MQWELTQHISRCPVRSSAMCRRSLRHRLVTQHSKGCVRGGVGGEGMWKAVLFMYWPQDLQSGLVMWGG